MDFFLFYEQDNKNLSIIICTIKTDRVQLLSSQIVFKIVYISKVSVVFG
jgi:hypothetical protein